MKAEISQDNRLVLYPESGTEAYALQRWINDRGPDPKYDVKVRPAVNGGVMIDQLTNAEEKPAAPKPPAFKLVGGTAANDQPAEPPQI